MIENVIDLKCRKIHLPSGPFIDNSLVTSGSEIVEILSENLSGYVSCSLSAFTCNPINLSAIIAADYI